MKYGHRPSQRQQHSFSHVPTIKSPRSTFKRVHTHKSAYDEGYIYPFYLDEVLPGDTFNTKVTAFARMATPKFPIMDDIYMDFHYFFVPNRLLWDNWQKFMGEQVNPGDSIDFTVPQVTIKAADVQIEDLADHMGIPPGKNISVNALYFRAYNLIWNEWFRDENLQNSVAVPKTDGPDVYEPTYVVLKRSKRHDYFTSCLPWPQKGDAVTLPVALPAKSYLKQERSTPNTTFNAVPDHYLVPTSAISSNSSKNADWQFATPSTNVNWLPFYSPINTGSTGFHTFLNNPITGTNINRWERTTNWGSGDTINWVLDGRTLYADNSGDSPAAVTINALRLAFQQQRFLERDARGGTRYTEIVQSHFGVKSPDQRLQRPEYLGGTSTPLKITPVAQTNFPSASELKSPKAVDQNALGGLAGVGFATTHGRKNGFTKSFVEHGVILGLVSFRSNITYQQGVHKRFLRSTRYDYYFPVFAHLGEQVVENREIFLQGTTADTEAFGYQERWAEYRYGHSTVTSFMRSSADQSLDVWHLAQNFANLPKLNSEFIEESAPMSRVQATSNTPDFIFDSKIESICARPMPTYSIPGYIDRF